MNMSKMKPFFYLPLCFLGLVLLTMNCAHKVTKPTGPLDTPGNRVSSGLKMLNSGQMVSAEREFRKALEIDPKYSPAFQNMGLALGYKGDFEGAFKMMSKAKKYSRNQKEEAMVHVGFMRLYTLQKGKDWLEKVKVGYDDALAMGDKLPEAHYYMGVAFKEARQLDEAAIEFKKVLSTNSTKVMEADDALRTIQKVQRAMPGSESGKRLAFQEGLNRAEMAALLIHELRLGEIYDRGKIRRCGQKMIPEDIKDHPLREDITAVIRAGVRGIEPLPDGSFAPDAMLTRSALTMIIEDIVSTLTHNRKLTVQYLDCPSPFPDVINSAPYYNAVMFCTTTGFMSAVDPITSRFEPGGSAHGADILLIIRRLKEEFKIISNLF